MLKNETYFIDSCDDAELNIKRESKLEYRITYDDDKEMKAVVFIIGGYGINVDLQVMDFNRQFIAKKFNVVAVNVLYHCFGCRINGKDKNYSASFSYDDRDVEYFKAQLNKQGFVFSEDINKENIQNQIASLESLIDFYKSKNTLPNDFKFCINSTLSPSNNEYQNYGIMAAIDHINALKDMCKKFPIFGKLPKIYGGCSYGGYLSLLIAKIAPWYVDGVVDNSGEATLILGCIMGKDLNFHDIYYNYKSFVIGCFIKTYWNSDKLSPCCFKDEHFLIRTLLNKEHLILQAQKNKNIFYTSYHSSKDLLTSCENKSYFIELLKILNYQVDFNLIKETDIDGKFVKNLEHGCGIKDKSLFNKELPKILEKFKNKNFILKEDSISYPCKDKVFTFKDKGDKFVLEII
ncbi:UNVERIFIED_CONTAM: DUF2920 family protein [Campylobacter lari]|nr:DUF2920 family protein [Campylobacter lari]MCV3342303.1 DUF2920 family protein [Campylobacter lari]MCV3390473.1 DUF2920 family protein [Campylobacter lari]MCV3401205.1 DUF2920 family protein [Campylobacter lari]MCV3412362.1 DUF2920 family protein [Campylobacter lari]